MKNSRQQPPNQQRPVFRKGSRTQKIVADLLRKTGRPLHIDEIIQLAKAEGVELHRESIVSAMTKKLLEGKLFKRTGRNEFALLAVSSSSKEVK